MVIHAYDKYFLPDMKKKLGFAIDYAVNGCGLSADSFYDFFIASKVAQGIENGSPIFVCGCSGTELALSVFERVGYNFDVKKTQLSEKTFFSFDRSPEYWAGWILAYYQWNTNLSFSKIREYATLSDIVNMYYPLHEAPEEKFLDVMNDIIQKKNLSKKTNLHQLRKLAGLTQKELAELSGVNIRTLQQYEIGAKDINHASGETINSLARALRCNFYDVMEIDLNS